ncbi:MAG: hypothetical protein ABIE94_02635, partial [archaeon]
MAYLRDILIRTAWDNKGNYADPSNYHVGQRLSSVEGLHNLPADLFILDYDHTLSPTTHGLVYPPMVDTLQELGPRAQIDSTYSIDEMKMVRDHMVQAGVQCVPLNKLVRFEGLRGPHLIRFVEGELQVWQYYEEQRELFDLTKVMCSGDKLDPTIEYDYVKPNPLIVRALFDLYKHQTKSSGGRVPKRPRIDVVGNSYVLDVVSANL